MSRMKEVDLIAHEIADVLHIHHEQVNLSQVPGGWLADVYSCGETIQGSVLDDPIDAMNSLLEVAGKKDLN